MHDCSVATCRDGDIRIGIFNFTEFSITIDQLHDYYFIKDEIARGRVEVCVGGRFGSVCGSDWDDNDASVTCTQLGFSSNGSLINQPFEFL